MTFKRKSCNDLIDCVLPAYQTAVALDRGLKIILMCHSFYLFKGCLLLSRGKNDNFVPS